MQITSQTTVQPVKSRQSGSLEIPGATLQAEAVIDEINVEKAMLTFSWDADQNDARAEPRGAFVNGTTLRFRRGWSTGITRVDWTVVEFT